MGNPRLRKYSSISHYRYLLQAFSVPRRRDIPESGSPLQGIRPKPKRRGGCLLPAFSVSMAGRYFLPPHPQVLHMAPSVFRLPDGFSIRSLDAARSGRIPLPSKDI
jgi:hypothetical protein